MRQRCKRFRFQLRRGVCHRVGQSDGPAPPGTAHSVTVWARYSSYTSSAVRLPTITSSTGLRV